jgi:hypothetical protein
VPGLSAINACPARFAVVLVVHGPDIEAVAGDIHHGIFFRARNCEIIARSGQKGRPLYKEENRERRLTCCKPNRALAVHSERHRAFAGRLLKPGESEKALGDKFSLRRLHNKVLATGTVPLEFLGSQVDAWIKSQA